MKLSNLTRIQELADTREITAMLITAMARGEDVVISSIERDGISIVPEDPIYARLLELLQILQVQTETSLRALSVDVDTPAFSERADDDGAEEDDE